MLKPLSPERFSATFSNRFRLISGSSVPPAISAAPRPHRELLDPRRCAISFYAPQRPCPTSAPASPKSRLIAALEEVSENFVPAIIALGVSALEPFHACQDRKSVV